MADARAIHGRDGRDGRDGKDADPAEIERLVREFVATLPKAKDGTSVTVEDVLPLIQQLVNQAVAAIPKPKDGRDGRDGAAAPRKPWRMVVVRDEDNNLIDFVDLVPIEE